MAVVIRHGHGKGPKSPALKRVAPTEKDKRAIVQAVRKGDTSAQTSIGQVVVKTDRRD